MPASVHKGLAVKSLERIAVCLPLVFVQPGVGLAWWSEAIEVLEHEAGNHVIW